MICEKKLEPAEVISLVTIGDISLAWTLAFSTDHTLF